MFFKGSWITPIVLVFYVCISFLLDIWIPSWLSLVISAIVSIGFLIFALYKWVK